MCANYKRINIQEILFLFTTTLELLKMIFMEDERRI
jgi:hypothetical protein